MVVAFIEYHKRSQLIENEDLVHLTLYFGELAACRLLLDSNWLLVSTTPEEITDTCRRCLEPLFYSQNLSVNDAHGKLLTV